MDPSVNLYEGFVPPKGWVPEKVADISPQDFFLKFVSTRTPVILSSIFSDIKVHDWSISKLQENLAGKSSVVNVETKDPASGQFGKCKKISMEFRDFLTKLQSGDDSLYMTTQIIEDDMIGLPTQLFGQPLQNLQKFFPVRPTLLGNLLPNNINIWLGRSKNGTTSGLHHDFHDNLYVLLHGNKSFTIAAPTEASNMYLNGSFKTIHKNGLINYEGIETLPDGSVTDLIVEFAEAAVQRKTKILKDLGRAKAPKEQIELAKKQLKLVERNLQDDADYAESMEKDIAPEDDDEDGEGEGEEDGDQNQDEESMPDEGEGDEDGEGNGDDGNGEEKPKHEPDHFSKAFSVQDESKLSDFPTLKNVNFIRFDLKEGEMLFLPASWFHEVVSQGSGDNNIHFALNYWTHPMENKDFEKPYKSHFWENFVENINFENQKQEEKKRKAESHPPKKQPNKKKKID